LRVCYGRRRPSVAFSHATLVLARSRSPGPPVRTHPVPLLARIMRVLHVHASGCADRGVATRAHSFALACRRHGQPELQRAPEWHGRR
jgi:hypothetical protein